MRRSGRGWHAQRKRHHVPEHQPHHRQQRGVLAATGSSFDVARANLQISGRFTGRSITTTYSCNGGGTNPPAQMAPIPTNGPLGLALMSLLLGAALPARRWLNKRRQSAR
ncbi:hypothetical protein [Ottowia sp. VDI28]|uniref:hypothetical protein n=1 Tax=Ottowia sp. VDI28 TaxID=3133968 RepID=UPI003C3061A1